MTWRRRLGRAWRLQVWVVKPISSVSQPAGALQAGPTATMTASPSFGRPSPPEFLLARAAGYTRQSSGPRVATHTHPATRDCLGWCQISDIAGTMHSDASTCVRSRCNLPFNAALQRHLVRRSGFLQERRCGHSGPCPAWTPGILPRLLRCHRKRHSRPRCDSGVRLPPTTTQPGNRRIRAPPEFRVQHVRRTHPGHPDVPTTTPVTSTSHAIRLLCRLHRKTTLWSRRTSGTGC